MSKPTHKEHDFSAKLRQSSVIDDLRKYIQWRRNGAGQQSQPMPGMAPKSINLDLTTACNFSCPHCVDWQITNTGQSLKAEEVKQSIDTLKSKGLLSIILLGGGEPTLYKNFSEIVEYIKDKGLQLGIVTNGSRLSKIREVAGRFGKHDWVRLSLDAATQKTFERLHRPRKQVLLSEILKEAEKLKKINPDVSLGYSFVIMWEGLEFNGQPLQPNLEEMTLAVELAAKHGFDYISFKPCLIRLPDLHKETLLDSVDRENEIRIVQSVEQYLKKARKAASGKIRLMESVNLIAMLNHQTHTLKQQPKTCHMQIFNTVLAPAGIFHCPAFRGVDSAKIGEADGYAGDKKFNQTLQNLARSINGFNPKAECDRIACFYNHVNWWMENFIQSDKSVDQIKEAPDDNFFF